MVERYFKDSRSERITELIYSLAKNLVLETSLERLTSHLTQGGVTIVDDRALLELLREKDEIFNVQRRSLRRHAKRRKVSALHYKAISYCGYSIEAPCVEGNLTPTRKDAKILYFKKNEIMEFLENVQKYFACWCQDDSTQDSDCWVEIPWSDVNGPKDVLSSLCTWCEINFIDEINRVRYPDGDITEEPTIEFHIYGFMSPPTMGSFSKQVSYRHYILSNEGRATLASA